MHRKGATKVPVDVVKCMCNYSMNACCYVYMLADSFCIGPPV